MQVNHIIVQAGGKGSRMQSLTRNKPKPLVPVRNLPIMFHLFRAFPECHFTIIGDYKFDVLKNYLDAFADVEYQLVDARGETGTCAGLREAVANIPSGEPFMLTWGDLVLPADFDIEPYEGCVVGLSKDFTCRWKYENGVFCEEPSAEYGVAGLFLFDSPAHLADVPGEGEFVAWLANANIPFSSMPIYGTREYGLYEEYCKLPTQKCRPFNRITVCEDTLIKEGIDAQGKDLAEKEVAWYRKLTGNQFRNLPHIFKYEPLVMERIDGGNVYEYPDLSLEQKRNVISQIIDCLQSIHEQESVPADAASYYEAYIGKTFKRLEKVRNLVPFAQDSTIVVNGQECPNPFQHKDEIEACMARYMPKRFELIHGDCTFSNIMLRSDGSPVLIDPRGYFGTTQFYGDPAYDWGKLFYSLAGNYDQFNLKRFDLDIRDDEAVLSVKSNGWEGLEGFFFDKLADRVSVEQIKMMHAIIWLSLTTYAWEDFDSICGAFYQGILYLKEAL